MKILIHELKEGILFSKDVTSPNGQLLLKKGIPVTDKHIKAFKMWGILEFEVEGEEGATQSTPLSFSAEILTQSDALLQKHFFGSDLSNPVLSKIYSFCLNRLATKLSQTGAPS